MTVRDSTMMMMMMFVVTLKEFVFLVAFGKHERNKVKDFFSR